MIQKHNSIKTRVKKSKEDKLFSVFAYTVVLLLTVIVLLPMVYIVSASFSSPSAVTAGKVTVFPVDPTLYSYKQILKYNSIWLGYRNTIFYTIVGTCINVVTTLFCAYPLARKNFSGRKFFSTLFFFTMIFPAGMIPNYMLMRDLKLINTVWSILLPGALSAYNMIVTRTFIESTISESIFEAAKLDGSNDFQFFFYIVLPLSKAIIAVITLYYAVGHWNNYFNAFLYLSKKELYPLQLFLREILVQNKFDSSVMSDPEMASRLAGLQESLKYVVIVVSTLPLMCIYPFVQKYFVEGVMIGSVKG